MADDAEEPLDNQDDELLLTDEVDGDDDAGNDDDQQGDEEQSEEGDDEEIIGFEDETSEKPDDTGLVKHLRTQLKERDKRLAELSRSVPAEKPIEVGEKPTLMGCDYDEEAYERELDAWRDRKAEAERREADRGKASEEQAAQWQQELERVADEQKALNRPDSEEAFDVVRAALSPEQQSALVMATDKGNTAKLIYALAKNPDRLTTIAGETNIIRFIKHVTQLEGKLTVTKQRKAPNVEEVQRGSARASALPASKQLEKLEREADRTGDRTALIKFQREQKQKAAK